MPSRGVPRHKASDKALRRMVVMESIGALLSEGMAFLPMPLHWGWRLWFGLMGLAFVFGAWLDRDELSARKRGLRKRGLLP